MRVPSACSMRIACCANENGMFRSERVRKVPEGKRTCTLVRAVRVYGTDEKDITKQFQSLIR